MSLDSKATVNTVLESGFSSISRFLSDVNLKKYSAETKVQYSHSNYADYMYEMYHPQVFANPYPVWYNYPPPNHYLTHTAWRVIGPEESDISPKQYHFERNNKLHNERMEIAAKAALMLYRTPKQEEIEEADFSETAKNTAKRERNEARENYEEANRAFQDSSRSNLTRDTRSNMDLYRDMESQKTLFNSKQDRVAEMVAPGLQLDTATFNAVAGMKSATEKLPSSLDRFRKASCYGLWGKWYDKANGFHRGIDITFTENRIIYSICDGKVINLQKGGTGSLSYLTIETNDGKYITYMHAKFEDFDENDLISLGDKIGIEKNYMTGGGAFHTHIELNGTNPAPSKNSQSNAGQFTQAKHPIESIYSLEPYAFLNTCFKSFHKTVTNANK